MAKLAGYGGSVNVATATVAGIRAWTCDHTFATLETTGFDSSGHKAFIPGIDEWSGTFEGFKDGAPLTIGTEIALILKEATAVATQWWTGQAIIMGRHPNASVDGAVTYSYDFQGTAALVGPTT